MSTGADTAMPYTIIGTVVAKPATREELLDIRPLTMLSRLASESTLPGA